jgi:hypothetical protein
VKAPFFVLAATGSNEFARMRRRVVAGGGGWWRVVAGWEEGAGGAPTKESRDAVEAVHKVLSLTPWPHQCQSAGLRLRFCAIVTRVR